MNLSLDHWKSLSAGEREAAAKQLALNLPSGFAFASVEHFQLGTCEKHVALFRFGKAKFALIPGGVIDLGFDPARQWNPTSDEQESWQSTANEYGIQESIHEHLVAATKPPRQVELAPFLIETVAVELGWESTSVNDPEIQKILKGAKCSRVMEVCHGEQTIRIRRQDDGSIIAERNLARTPAELGEQLQKAGFRFPTSDEWEYACGCGEPTLFRWGDHAPCDRYPTDKVQDSPEGFPSNWDLHLRPNAFGLFIASNPYYFELLAEIGATRGGDGGGMICGGAGFFVGWLALATAYFEEHACIHDPAEPIAPGYTIGRRVFALK